MVYNSEEDLKFDRKLKVIRKELEHARGQFTFDPDDFKEAASGFKEEAYQLPEQGLLEYAKAATQLRKQFTERALASKAEDEAATEGDDQEAGFTVPKLSRGCARKR